MPSIAGDGILTHTPEGQKMSRDNILPFPYKLKDAFDEAQWQSLQGEFYLDCFTAQHGVIEAELPELRP